MADKLVMALKTYQNFENGVTKLDYERLKAVSDILEVDVEDLINSEDGGVYIGEIKDTNVAYNADRVEIHNPETKGERALFEKIIATKDEQIALLKRTIEILQNTMDRLK